MKRTIGYFVGSLLVFGNAVMGTTPAAAESAADFFKGKTITYIVASGPNRSTDIYGRLAAKYMQNYIPGSKFVVENVPSPRQVSGANRIYAAKAGIESGEIDVVALIDAAAPKPGKRGADKTRNSN